MPSMIIFNVFKLSWEITVYVWRDSESGFPKMRQNDYENASKNYQL